LIALSIGSGFPPDTRTMQGKVVSPEFSSGGKCGAKELARTSVEAAISSTAECAFA
jgi:hypothetical protein